MNCPISRFVWAEPFNTMGWKGTTEGDGQERWTGPVVG